MTPTVTPTVVPILGVGWQTAEVRNIFLSIDQAYPEFEAKEDEPIRADMVQILLTLGINVLNDAEGCDAMLTINLVGEAARDIYSFPGENKSCYSGSFYQGEMKLSAPQKPDVVVKVGGHYTPKMISTCHEEPYQDVNWITSWATSLVKGIRHLWGKHGLLLIMAQPDLNMTCIAAEQLFQIEKELSLEDVPILASSVQKCPEDIAPMLQAMGVQAWDAIPALLDAWEEKGPNGITYGTVMGYGTVLFQDALEAITNSFDPKPNCSSRSCWKTWWGSGQPVP